jgi:dimethylargininase
MFKNAITRTPAVTYAKGITTSNLGTPDMPLTLRQHQAYIDALKATGLHVVTLDPEPAFPDSTFVEDTAIVTADFAVITRPGADSRRGEIESIRPALETFFERIHTIDAPGTVDGGDICQAGQHFFIGISERTNPEGGQQLADILVKEGYTAALVDIRGMQSILHLKSGIAYLGNNTMVLFEELADHPAFQDYTILTPPKEEEYAANCVRINDVVFIAKGFPKTAALIAKAGFKLLELDMSEYRKMDGGLSCLSLRF